MELVRYSGENDWSALYVDGKLHIVGDHYLVDERISQLLGVRVIDSDDFMRGGNNYEHVAPTLKDIEAYLYAEDDKEADELEQQAQELEARAAQLRFERTAKLRRY